MKTVFAPILLIAVAAALAAPRAGARDDPRHDRLHDAAQRDARQDRAQREAERARARHEARSDRAQQQAPRARAQDEAQGVPTRRQAGSLTQGAVQSLRAQALADNAGARPEPETARARREARRERKTSHEPLILPYGPSQLHGTSAAALPAPEMRMPRMAVPVLPARAAASLDAVRGDELMREGEIAAARLLYGRAAAAGSAHAAVGLGRSYDPSVLATLGAGAADGDALVAAIWYRRAQLMGSHEADAQLQTLNLGPAG